MHTAEIRKRFLNYFEKRGHSNIPGSSLVPETDPSLLFTNSGMVQFKNIFLGAQKSDYQRACSAQLCLRAGGKHNDLENVGYTARHHTLFEMLGNFSFGDYFKKDAINYAWEFLTDDKVGLAIDPRHLWITVFGGHAVFGKNEDAVPADKESEQYWQECLKGSGFNDAEIKKRINRVCSNDNFWMMGEEGPCGPCTEIFYHPNRDMRDFVGEDPKHADECVEVWNLVFMQYNRLGVGQLKPLPKPCVDTGMGLERMAAAMQGVSGNYETDLFIDLMSAVNKAIVDAGGIDANGNYLAAHRVLADHIRAASFVILDGVTPSNEGRGYVLRRIIRRALRHAYQLKARHNCLRTMVKAVAKCMNHKGLAHSTSHVANILEAEEERFRMTLAQGMDMLETFFADKSSSNKAVRMVDGETVFRLYDTYGFPPDLTADIAQEHGAEVDMQGFEQYMARQRERARSATTFQNVSAVDLGAGSTEFIGYGDLSGETVINRIVDNAQGRSIKCLESGQKAVLIMERTPFYAEGGGQVGDRGALYKDKDLVFEVTNTTHARDLIAHHGVALKTIQVGDKILAKVDEARRRAVARNHSATHLLHASLIKVLGSHVQQKGSLVEKDKLRFDFSHHDSLSADNLTAVEDLINEQIALNSKVQVELMDQQEAIKRGAIALFGEKYSTQVRVLTMGEAFSIELCGGTHVHRTGDIGALVITEESGVSAGVRRIEAITGDCVREHYHLQTQRLKQLATTLKCSPPALQERLLSIQKRQRDMEKELKTLRERVATIAPNKSGAKNHTEIWKSAQDISGVKVLASKTVASDAAVLRNTVDYCRDHLGDSVVFLVAEQNKRLLLAASVSKSLCDKLEACALMRQLAPQLGGQGGGKADFAQGGGDNLAMVDAILKQVPQWVENHLS